MILKADLHVHSAASWDGRSGLAALAQAAHARGLDAIAVCDHDLCTDVSGSFPVLLIPGVEITSTAGHILGLFLGFLMLLSPALSFLTLRSVAYLAALYLILFGGERIVLAFLGGNDEW